MALLRSCCALILCLSMAGFVIRNVVLMGDNLSMSFDDVEAKFSKSFTIFSVFVLDYLV